MMKCKASGKVGLFRMCPTRVDDQYIYFDKNKIPRNGLDYRVFDDFEQAVISVKATIKVRISSLKEQLVMSEQALLRLGALTEDDVPVAAPSGKGKI